MKSDYLVRTDQRVFRLVNGVTETECRPRNLVKGDIFRVEGTSGWWKVMDVPYFNEQVLCYNFDVEQQEFLIG